MPLNFFYTKTCSPLKNIILSEAHAKLSNVHALNNTQTIKPAAGPHNFFPGCLFPGEDKDTLANMGRAIDQLILLFTD